VGRAGRQHVMPKETGTVGHGTGLAGAARTGNALGARLVRLPARGSHSRAVRQGGDAPSARCAATIEASAVRPARCRGPVGHLDQRLRNPQLLWAWRGFRRL
jgi:hypothetical protein